MSDLVASVQYDDFTGTAAADRHDNMEKAEKLAAKYGVDIKGRFVFGYRLNFSENRSGMPKGSKVRLSFLCADASVGSNFDSVEDAVSRNGGTLNYEEFDIDTTMEEAFDLFKRFEVVVRNKMKVSSFNEL